MRTTTTCRECGGEIPQTTIKDALCTGCRYHDVPKAAAWDSGRKMPGFQIRKHKGKGQTPDGSGGLHNGEPLDNPAEPTCGFDWSAIDGAQKPLVQRNYATKQGMEAFVSWFEALCPIGTEKDATEAVILVQHELGPPDRTLLDLANDMGCSLKTAGLRYRRFKLKLKEIGEKCA
jgi:hypothetical protein